MAESIFPRSLIFGQEQPDLRIRMERGEQITFCRRNDTLHLTGGDLDASGTYTMGAFLGEMCRLYCTPNREAQQPCPTFVGSQWELDDDRLAQVKLSPDAGKCGGVRHILDHVIGGKGANGEQREGSDEEVFFFSTYLRAAWGDDRLTRTILVNQWNKAWYHVSGPQARDRFDAMMWQTFRFPALIPQVWLNWLYATDDDIHAALDENPSRVDFVAFAEDHRHVIEIDGPSHYAHFDGHGYRVDEREYARNLKIERSLKKHDWPVTRIGRQEVRDLQQPETDEVSFPTVLSLMPFSVSRPGLLKPTDLGLKELEPDYKPDDDIPF